MASSSLETTRGEIADLVVRRLTMHNVHYLLSLMGKVRAAIIADRYPDFLRAYFSKAYGGDMTRAPTWAVTALREVGVDLLT